MNTFSDFSDFSTDAEERDIDLDAVMELANILSMLGVEAARMDMTVLDAMETKNAGAYITADNYLSEALLLYMMSKREAKNIVLPVSSALGLHSPKNLFIISEQQREKFWSEVMRLLKETQFFELVEMMDYWHAIFESGNEPERAKFSIYAIETALETVLEEFSTFFDDGTKKRVGNFLADEGKYIVLQAFRTETFVQALCNPPSGRSALGWYMKKNKAARAALILSEKISAFVIALSTYSKTLNLKAQMKEQLSLLAHEVVVQLYQLGVELPRLLNFEKSNDEANLATMVSYVTTAVTSRTTVHTGGNTTTTTTHTETRLSQKRRVPDMEHVLAEFLQRYRKADWVFVQKVWPQLSKQLGYCGNPANEEIARWVVNHSLIDVFLKICQDGNDNLWRTAKSVIPYRWRDGSYSIHTYARINTLLLDHFSEEDLDSVVKLHMSDNPGIIGKGGNLRTYVYNLITYYESHSRISEFLEGLAKAKPGLDW